MNQQQYKLEWIYKDGRLYSTWANTLEMAKQKAETYVKSDDVYFVSISECRLIEVLKEDLE